MPCRGRELFAQNCAQCHGVTGNGASVGSDDVAPSLAAASDLSDRRSHSRRPGVMPRFVADVLGDETLTISRVT